MLFVITLREPISNGLENNITIIECDSYVTGLEQIGSLAGTAALQRLSQLLELSSYGTGIKYQAGATEGWLPLSNVLGIVTKQTIST